MNNIILEFTYKGRKHTYFRRIDVYGHPVTTTNKNSAKRIKEAQIKDVTKLLIKELGVSDVTPIKDEE